MKSPIDGVLIYTHGKRLYGSVLDAFEYYIKILEYQPNVKLFLLNTERGDKEYFQKVFENRYDLSNLDWKNNIISLPKIKLLQFQFRNVLIVSWGTIPHVKGLLQANKIYIITEGRTSDPNYFLNPKLYNVIYYTEMPFEYRDLDYKMKFLFDRFKPLTQVEPNILVHAPGYKYTDKDNPLRDILSKFEKPVIFKTLKHKENFFESFDTFIYYHTGVYWDPHPRLFMECKYYEKEILFYNMKDIKDGAYYRYLDMITNGIKNRYLTRQDKIIKEFI